MQKLVRGTTVPLHCERNFMQEKLDTVSKTQYNLTQHNTTQHNTTQQL